MRNLDFVETGTIYKLEQWGLYMRKDSELSNLALRRGSGEGGKEPDINEDQAMWVETGIAKLKKRDEFLGGLLVGYYFKNWRLVEIAEQSKVSRYTISSHLRGAEAWMDCYFMTNAHRILTKSELQLVSLHDFSI